MTTTTAATPPATLAAPPAPTRPRLDFYTPIHKALRAFMSHTLLRLGALDVVDDAERSDVLDQLDALLAQLRSHLDHENTFVHAALDARLPGASMRTAGDHEGHVESIANLEDEGRALRHARPGQRAALALNLYRHLSAFVAENLEHMLVEERDNGTALWALYDDAELEAIHDALVASIAPDEMMRTMHWFAVALPLAELAAMFAEMRTKAPPPVFEAMLGVARRALDDGRWAKLARALGEPPVAGLVTV